MSTSFYANPGAPDIAARLAQHARGEAAYSETTGWQRWNGVSWEPDPHQTHIHQLTTEVLMASYADSEGDHRLEGHVRAYMTWQGTKQLLHTAQQLLPVGDVEQVGNTP